MHPGKVDFMKKECFLNTLGHTKHIQVETVLEAKKKKKFKKNLCRQKNVKSMLQLMLNINLLTIFG